MSVVSDITIAIGGQKRRERGERFCFCDYESLRLKNTYHPQLYQPTN